MKKSQIALLAGLALVIIAFAAVGLYRSMGDYEPLVTTTAGDATTAPDGTTVPDTTAAPKGTTAGGSAQSTTASPATEAPEQLGLAYGEYAVQDGAWIYYATGSGIYKIGTDGKGEKRLLENVFAHDLVLADGWLHYLAWDEEDIGLFKMKTDGSGQKRLAKDVHSLVGVYENTVWFSRAAAAGNTVHSVSSEGKNEQKLCGGIGGGVFREWLYYTENSAVYRLNLQTKKSEKLLNRYAHSFFYYGEWILFADAQGIWEMHADGSAQKQLVAGDIGGFLILQDVLYYTKPNEGIYQADIHGKNEKRIVKDNVSAGFSIAGGALYYTTDTHDPESYKIQLDGSGKVKL